MEETPIGVETMIEEAIMEMIGGIADNNIKGDQSMEILLCQVKMIYTKKSVDEKETLSHPVREILYPDVHRARKIVLPIQMIVAEDPLRLLLKGPCHRPWTINRLPPRQRALLHQERGLPKSLQQSRKRKGN